MFSIDFPEIIIIFAVALVVLGPKKLPGAAAKIGRWVGRARSMARQFREQLEQEVANAENAVDIRDSLDSTGQPARKPPSNDAAGAAQPQSTPAQAGAQAHPTQGVPPEAGAHESPQPESAVHDSPSQEAIPDEPMPYHSSMPDHPMPPPEGYGPAPQQLSFDQQLHDTALPPAGESDAREWMPETQTWMASAGWEVPESSGREGASSSPGTSPEVPPARSPTPSPGSRPASEPEDTGQSPRPNAVDRHDR